MAVKPYTYFYQSQIKTYIKQWLRIYSGLQVEYGVDRDNSGSLDRRTVPVHYGSMDRIVANVLHRDGTFISNTLPIMSGYMTSLELNPEIKKATRHEENVVMVNESDNSKVTNRKTMGVPYKMNMDLSIFASNTDQMFQLLEQILLLFNPKLTIQKSDNVIDWTYLTEVELLAISNEENLPSGIDERMIIQTLSFSFDIWLNFPYIEKASVIEEITANVLDNTVDPTGVNLDTFIIP